MSERKLFCNFSIETPIYDVDLPNKILEKLNSLDLHPNPEYVYDFSVDFDVDIYLESEFYNFPVEEKPKDKEKTPTENDILGQQIHNIRDALKSFPIKFSTASIAGENVNGDINQVHCFIFEDPTKKKEKNAITCTLVIPDRMAMFNNFIKAFEDIKKRQEKEEQTKTQEIALHTPEMKSVEEIFLALATAILEDHPDKSTSPVRLSREMILQGQIVDDWPLEIRGHVKYEAKEKRVLDMGQIDCPEFLVYVKSKSYWTLSKVPNLEAAKNTVLTKGYNYKDVEQVIVLHNLKNVKFKLYSRTRDEVEPISKRKAHAAKNLLLSWVKSRK